MTGIKNIGHNRITLMPKVKAFVVYLHRPKSENYASFYDCFHKSIKVLCRIMPKTYNNCCNFSLICVRNQCHVWPLRCLASSDERSHMKDCVTTVLHILAPINNNQLRTTRDPALLLKKVLINIAYSLYFLASNKGTPRFEAINCHFILYSFLEFGDERGKLLG